MLVSRSRSAIFAAVIYFLFSSYFRRCKPGKSLRAEKAAAVLMLLFAFIFTAIYMLLLNSEVASTLNILSMSYTGKNFFSGRQMLWGNLIEAISLRPFFGYGLNALPNLVVDTNLSSHNLYLQTLLQGGFAGMFLLAAFMARILRDIQRTDLAPEGAAYICAVIFNECFEPTITQTGFVYGCVTWMILGIMANSRGR